MRGFLFVAALTLGACIADTAFAQGRGGGGRGGPGGGCGARMSGASGSLASGLLSGGLDSMSSTASAIASPARLQRQLQSALGQQAFLSQVQSALLAQQASAARKAEQKNRQLANRRARREAELARRGGNLPSTSPRSRASALASTFN